MHPYKGWANPCKGADEPLQGFGRKPLQGFGSTLGILALASMDLPSSTA